MFLSSIVKDNLRLTRNHLPRRLRPQWVSPRSALRTLAQFLFAGVLLLGTLGAFFDLRAQPREVGDEMVANEFRHAPLRARGVPFRVPAGLQARVNFWVDIFTKYGKDQLVVHHRYYPYIVFKVLNFSGQAQSLSPVAYEKYRERALDQTEKELLRAIRVLASGAAPSTDEERLVARKMAVLPEGVAKYQEMLDDDLIRGQSGIREKYAEAVARAGRYLPIMEVIFTEEFALPIELTRLPFVESSFDYTAYSSVGAAGIWQFMRATGKKYMTVTKLVDERRDPIEATRAAAKYLQHAYATLNAWPLALTSYNHGIAGVLSKVRKFGSENIVTLIERPVGEDHPFGFASSNFFPSFLAALEVYDRRHEYFPGVRMEAPLRMASRRLAFSISVREIERRLGITSEELRQYNYAIAEEVWKGRYSIPAGYVLKVPYRFRSLLPVLESQSSVGMRAPAPPASVVYGGVTYTVRRGDTLGSIAKRFHTTVTKIREMNDLGSSELRIGQRLVVGGHGPTAPVVKTPEPRLPGKEAHGRARRIHTVRSGESLWSIAKKLGTSVAELRSENGLAGQSTVKVGQRLKIP